MSALTGDRVRLSSVSGIIGARMGVMLCSLVTGIVSARILGPAGRGQYFAVTTISALLAQTLNLGLSSSNVFLGAQDHGRLRHLLINSAYLCVILTILSGALVAVAGTYLGRVLGMPADMLWGVCAIGPAALFFTLASSLLVAAERFRALNWWQIINAGATVCAVCVCAMSRTGPKGFVLGTAAAAAITALGLLLFMTTESSDATGFSWPLVRMGLSFSFRAYLALLLGYFLQRAGAGLIASHGKPAELGEYSIASQLFDVLIIIPGSVGTVLFPLVVRRRDNSWPHVRQTTVITMSIMLVMCAAAALLAPLIIPLVFGARFAASVPVLWALLPAVLCYSLVSVLSQYLVSRNFPWLLVIAWLFGLALALSVGVALAARYGAVGAALAQSVGSAVVCGAVLLLLKERLQRRI